MNLIRIRVAKALEPSVLRLAKYKINWDMKSLADLEPLYQKVMGFLKKTEYGEYLAMKTLFGEQVATRVAMRGQMKVPPFVTSQQKASAQEADN